MYKFNPSFYIGKGGISIFFPTEVYEHIILRPPKGSTDPLNVVTISKTLQLLFSTHIISQMIQHKMGQII